MGTCHVRGAQQRILEEFERLLSIEAGQTTEDRLFTLETVNCLRACALGPIVTVDRNIRATRCARQWQNPVRLDKPAK